VGVTKKPKSVRVTKSRVTKETEQCSELLGSRSRGAEGAEECIGAVRVTKSGGTKETEQCSGAVRVKRSGSAEEAEECIGAVRVTKSGGTKETEQCSGAVRVKSGGAEGAEECIGAVRTKKSGGSENVAQGAARDAITERHEQRGEFLPLRPPRVRVSRCNPIETQSGNSVP